MEGLPLCLHDVPVVLSAVAVQPSVHVYVLHSRHEGQNCSYGPSVQEGRPLKGLLANAKMHIMVLTYILISTVSGHQQRSSQNVYSRRDSELGFG